jgi:hypothetical protein
MDGDAGMKTSNEPDGLTSHKVAHLLIAQEGRLIGRDPRGEIAQDIRQSINRLKTLEIILRNKENLNEKNK